MALRVLLIPASYPPVPGGLQTVVHALARSLEDLGHSVHVVTNKYPRTLPALEVIDQITVTRWHFLAPQLRFLFDLRFDLFLASVVYLPLTLSRLVLLLRRERPDVVNMHFVGGQALFVLLARWFANFHLVVSLHGDDVEGFARRTRFDRWIFRALLRRADEVTACSNYLLQQAVEVEPLAQVKGRAVYNGIDPLPSSTNRRGTRNVLAVGRLEEVKGFDTLLRAQAANGGHWRLTILGDGSERQALEQLARDLGLNGNVRFQSKKSRPQVLAAIAETDLVIVPSRKDSFGMVALEGMASGKPVVATRVGGLPEVLKGADAILVDPDNPTQLAEAIETALERISRDPNFGLRNRECAAYFSIQRMADSYLESYQRA